MLTIRLGNKNDLQWAQNTVKERHYLYQKVNNQARPMVYVIGDRLGLIMVSSPHAPMCKTWWGYDGVPTQWQVVDLCRIWLDPRIQKGGELCRPEICPGFIGWRGKWWPSVASWAIEEVLKRVQKDRVSMYPPVFPDQPYHIRLVISYHDPKFHRGTIYKVTSAMPMYTDDDGCPIPSSSGKFGWCWKLPEPAWKWNEIKILRPRTMRLAFL